MAKREKTGALLAPQAEIERARREIALGAEQLDQGRTLDAETFFAEWDAELERAVEP